MTVQFQWKLNNSTIYFTLCSPSEPFQFPNILFLKNTLQQNEYHYNPLEYKNVQMSWLEVIIITFQEKHNYSYSHLIKMTTRDNRKE